MTKEQVILQSNLEACRQRIAKLRYSVEKNACLFPMTSAVALALTDEQEDVGDKSNRDKTLLMEKLGAIESAEAFGTAALLRNKFSHHYPEESSARLERLNLVVEEARFVTSTFEGITAYLNRKGLTGPFPLAT